MKVHFEYPSGLNQQDVEAFMAAQGIQGAWFDWELNVFQLDTGFTSENFCWLADVCKNGFKINEIPVRGYILVPPPPKLQRVTNHI
jgi:hypothetical protein